MCMMQSVMHKCIVVKIGEAKNVNWAETRKLMKIGWKFINFAELCGKIKEA